GSPRLTVRVSAQICKVGLEVSASEPCGDDTEHQHHRQCREVSGHRKFENATLPGWTRLLKPSASKIAVRVRLSSLPASLDLAGLEQLLDGPVASRFARNLSPSEKHKRRDGLRL